jgi:hypothetical protein
MLAEKIGQENGYGTTTSSLMFGVQWDAVCVFIEHYDTNNTAETKSQWLKSNDYSKLWGNYNNSTFTMNRGYYTTAYSSNPVTWKDKTSKTGSGNWLCTTGASDQNSSLNIYDFAGNLFEFSLERYSNSSNPCTYRGGYFSYNSCASYRYGYNTYSSYYNSSARPSLFL